MGSALAARWGGIILQALGPVSVVPLDRPLGPRRRALEEWRRGAAAELGVPAYVVLRDATLDLLAASDAADVAALLRRVDRITPQLSGAPSHDLALDLDALNLDPVGPGEPA